MCSQKSHRDRTRLSVIAKPQTRQYEARPLAGVLLLCFWKQERSNHREKHVQSTSRQFPDTFGAHLGRRDDSLAKKSPRKTRRYPRSTPFPPLSAGAPRSRCKRLRCPPYLERLRLSPESRARDHNGGHPPLPSTSR